MVRLGIATVILLAGGIPAIALAIGYRLGQRGRPQTPPPSDPQESAQEGP